MQRQSLIKLLFICLNHNQAMMVAHHPRFLWQDISWQPGKDRQTRVCSTYASAPSSSIIRNSRISLNKLNYVLRRIETAKNGNKNSCGVVLEQQVLSPSFSRFFLMMRKLREVQFSLSGVVLAFPPELWRTMIRLQYIGKGYPVTILAIMSHAHLLPNNCCDSVVK